MIESLIFFKFPYITSGNMMMRTRLRRNKLLTTRNSQIMQHVFANLYFISINSINILTKLTDSLAYKRASSQPIIRPPFAAAAKAPNSCFWFENKYIFKVLFIVQYTYYFITTTIFTVYSLHMYNTNIQLYFQLSKTLDS